MRTTATVLLALTLSVWSATTIIVDFHTGPYRALAEWLESGPEGVRDPRYIARIDNALTRDEVSWLCSRDMVRSAASIRLSILDASYRTGSAIEQQAALAKASDTLRGGLRCYPNNGNFWLRLAMVEYARTGPTDSVQEMLQASLSAAPSDAWVIMPRIAFASRLLGSQFGGAEEVLRIDVDNLVKYGTVPDVADVYVSVNEAAQRILNSTIEGLDDERLLAIETSVARRVSRTGTDK